MLSASLIWGTVRSQRFVPPSAEYIAHTPFATGKRADTAKPRTSPVFVPGGFGAVKCREAAHPMDAPPA